MLDSAVDSGVGTERDRTGQNGSERIRTDQNGSPQDQKFKKKQKNITKSSPEWRPGAILARHKNTRPAAATVVLLQK